MLGFCGGRHPKLLLVGELVDYPFALVSTYVCDPPDTPDAATASLPGWTIAGHLQGNSPDLVSQYHLLAEFWFRPLAALAIEVPVAYPHQLTHPPDR